MSSAAATIVASPFAAHAAGVSSLKGSLDEQGRKAAAARRTKLAMDAAASGAPTQAAEASAASAARRQDLASERDVIKVLYAYLEEMERDIFARKWGTLMEYVKVFTQQEAAFAALVESSFGTAEAYDRDATAALEFEAGRIFLALDDMADAAAYRNVARAEQAYAALAIAYDRFLKAGDLYDAYDETDTSKLYAAVPKEMLVYDREATPKVPDSVLIIDGPDKGRLGRLIGISEASKTGVVRVTYGRRNPKDPTFEVKVMELRNLAKTKPDKGERDAQMKDLMMCPGGLRLGKGGFNCRQ